jgi:steroid delta-isomerase-like uncharacterized protein
MSTKENKTILRRYVDELNRRNLSLLDELVAEDVVFSTLLRGNPDPEFGREAYRQGILRRIVAFPDYHVSIEEMIAEDDQVVLYWTNLGTHRGTFLGVALTGRVIEEAAISIYRLAGDQIVEVRGYWDQADTWQQLGLMPEIGEGA